MSKPACELARELHPELRKRLKKNPNVMILDNDGVLRREGLQLPGVVELFVELERSHIQSVLLSNNSRVTSDGLVRQMHKFGVSSFQPDQAMTSAEGAAAWVKQHPSAEKPEDMRVFAVGEEGVFRALQQEGIALANGDWDEKALHWKSLPTDVVMGFAPESMDYRKTMAGAWSAIRQGSRWIHTNGDISYRNERGDELPANGAQLAYLASTGKQPATVIGKPDTGMAEAALHRMGMTPDKAHIAVVGDNLTEDMELAERLRQAGWDAEGWMVLTGVTTREQSRHPSVQKVFEDIRAITEYVGYEIRLGGDLVL